MAADHGKRENRRMQTENEDPKKSRRKRDRIVELEAEVDQRDETIRLLNEALSRALDELNALDKAA